MARRAPRLHRPGIEGLSVDEIEVASVGPGEALVRVHAAALTRDELDRPLDRLPAMPSFELAGVVAPDVADVFPGEAVVALTLFDRDVVATDRGPGAAQPGRGIARLRVVRSGQCGARVGCGRRPGRRPRPAPRPPSGRSGARPPQRN